MKPGTALLRSVPATLRGMLSVPDTLLRPARYHLQTITPVPLPPPVLNTEDGFAQLSEIRMHYKVYGSGKQPLILIHGNGGDADALANAASYLANDYTVYATENRCHGQSSDPAEITYDLMAQDTAELIRALRLERPLVLGFSDGGIVALALAALFPDLPGAVIACGANSDPTVLKPDFLWGTARSYRRRHGKLALLMLTLPELTPAVLGRITCPTLIVNGQHDIAWPSDARYLHRHIAGSDLKVLRGEGHGSYLSDGKQAYALARTWFAAKGF